MEAMLNYNDFLYSKHGHREEGTSLANRVRYFIQIHMETSSKCIFH